MDPIKTGWTDPTCPVARALDVTGDRWSLLVVRDAMDGARSFTELQRRTGIARNILTDRLRKLCDRGLLEQVAATEGGRRRVYRLTSAGEDLFPVVVALRQWGERHAFEPGEERSSLLGHDGAPVPPLVPTAEDGTALTSVNTRVVRPVNG